MSKSKEQILKEIDQIIDSHTRAHPFHEITDFDFVLKLKMKNGVEKKNANRN